MELKELGLDQKTIAQKLGVTESAISQYLSSKRATEVQFNDTVDQSIRHAAKKIIGGGSVIFEMQQLLKKSFEERITCDVHLKMCDLPADCNECFTSSD